MRFGITGIIVALLGIAVGAAVAYGFLMFQIVYSEEGFVDPGQWLPSNAKNMTPSAVKLSVEGINPRPLGKILTGQMVETEFLVRNPSNDPLRFSLSGELPSSLRTDLPAGEVTLQPHGTYPVTMTVTPTDPDANFSKSLVLQTGEGARTLLTVTADVQPGLIVEPRQVSFSRNAIGIEQAQLVVVSLTAESSIEIKNVEVENLGPVSWLKYELLDATPEQSTQPNGARVAKQLRLYLIESPPAEFTTGTLVAELTQTGFAPIRIGFSLID